MYLLFVFGLFAYCNAELPEIDFPPSNCSHLLNAEDPTEVYPTFPATSFTCWGRYDGYYADIEVDCTIFHYCQTWHFPTGLNETVKWDFACPTSTIFNQRILSCTQPNISFDCQESPNYFWVNLNYTLTTTPYVPTTPETTTPGSSFGQQLIVGGGIAAQSGEFQELVNSSVPEFEVSPSSDSVSQVTDLPESEPVHYPDN